MKRANFRDPSVFVNSAITLCYFILAVFLYDGLAHFVVGVTIAVPIIWFFTSDIMKRPIINLLPLWFLLSIWLCIGEFEDVVFQSSSRISVRDFIWLAMIVLSFMDRIVEANPDIFRIGCSVLLSSGVALATTDSLARRLSSFSMSYKVSCCILLYTAYEIRSNLRKEKERNITKFNLFQSAWVLFAWNSIVILAVPHIIYLVCDIVYLEPKPKHVTLSPVQTTNFETIVPEKQANPLYNNNNTPAFHNPNMNFSNNLSPLSLQSTYPVNNATFKPAPNFTNQTRVFSVPFDSGYNTRRTNQIHFKVEDDDDANGY